MAPANSRIGRIRLSHGQPGGSRTGMARSNRIDAGWPGTLAGGSYPPLSEWTSETPPSGLPMAWRPAAPPHATREGSAEPGAGCCIGEIAACREAIPAPGVGRVTPSCKDHGTRSNPLAASGVEDYSTAGREKLVDRQPSSRAGSVHADPARFTEIREIFHKPCCGHPRRRNYRSGAVASRRRLFDSPLAETLCFLPTVAIWQADCYPT